MKLSEQKESLQSTLNQCFGGIEDPRAKHIYTHQLPNIIIIAVLAILAGAEGWVGIETYGKAEEDWLRTFLDLPNGIPSHDTFAQVFARIDPEALEAGFQQWIGRLVSQLGAQIIAIDGKTLLRLL